MVIKGEIIVPFKEQRFAEKECHRMIESELARGLASRLLEEISPYETYSFKYEGVWVTYRPYDFRKVLSASIRIEPIKEAPTKIILERTDDNMVSLPKDKTFWQRLAIAVKYLFGKELDHGKAD